MSTDRVAPNLLIDFWQLTKPIIVVIFSLWGYKSLVVYYKFWLILVWSFGSSLKEVLRFQSELHFSFLLLVRLKKAH